MILHLRQIFAHHINIKRLHMGGLVSTSVTLLTMLGRVERMGAERSIRKGFDWQRYLDKWVYRPPNRETLASSKILINHIPKTGGSTLNELFRNIFGRRDMYLPQKTTNQKRLRFSDCPPEKLNKSRVISGHFYFGEHQSLPDKCLYLSMVRHPVDRLISMYTAEFIPERKKKRAEQGMDLINGLDLPDWLEQKIVNVPPNAYIGQLMTRITKTKKPLQAAKIIDRHYISICTTGQLDRMFAFIAELYDKDYTPFERRNVSAPIDPELRADLCRRYESYFEKDLAFVRFVEKRFEKQMQEFKRLMPDLRSDIGD